jgi:hypothetical protein
MSDDQVLMVLATMEQVRIACKMSPNVLLDFAERWTAMGLMELRADKKRVRLFNLSDFGMVKFDGKSASDAKK